MFYHSQPDIVVLVPLYDMIIYPLFAKVGLLKRQLSRMNIGLLLAILAFLNSALLEWCMQSSHAAMNPPDLLKVLNLSPCNLTLSINGAGDSTSDHNLAFYIGESRYQNNFEAKLPNELLAKLRDNSAARIPYFSLSGTCRSSGVHSALHRMDNLSVAIGPMQNVPRTLVFYLNETSQSLASYEYTYDSKSATTIGKSELRFVSVLFGGKEDEVPGATHNLVA